MLTKFNFFNKFNINEAKELSKIDLKAAHKIRRCFTQIMSYYGFFADLFFQLRIMQAHPTSKVKTMATDGKSIVYNADFVNRLTEEEVNFVLIHEVMHNANFHFSRMGDRNPKRWNRAADYAINLQIDDMRSEPGGTILKPPAKILLNQRFKVDGSILSAEQIYDILIKERPLKPKQQKPPKPKPQPIQIYPGMKVRNLETGKTGVVREIKNGKYIIDEIKEEYQKVVEGLYFPILNKVFEAFGGPPICNLPTVGNPEEFDRDEFIPIIKAPPKGPKGGPKGPPPPTTNDEFEVEGADEDDEDEDDDGDGDDDEDDGDEDDDEDGDEREKGEKGDGSVIDNSIPGCEDIRKPGSLGEQGDPLEGYEGSDDLSGAKSQADIDKTWGEILNNAKSKHAGTGSPSLDRWFNKIGKPKINWKRRLLKFMNQCFASQPKYGYFNKRFIGTNDYLPGMKFPKQEGFRNIILIIDTSGSIGQPTLSKFASEFYGILSSKKVMQTTVIWCDDVIQRVEIIDTKDKSGTSITKSEFESKFLAKLKPRGQGGTSFIPPFKWIEQNVIRKGQIPSFVVYFTDAAGSAPDPRKYGIPAYHKKVLWVITDCESAPHIKFPEKIFIDKNPDA